MSAAKPVIIIGAGPAGLAAAHCLAKRNLAYLLFEKGPSVASALRHVDPEMKLLSPTELSLLPGMKIDPGAPPYLPFKLLVHELERYQQQHGLKVTLNTAVTSVRREQVGFSIRCRMSDGEEYSIPGSHIINATGIISRPRLPENFKPSATTIRWMHSVDARIEHLAKARKLLVVGGGASAADVLENWLKVRQRHDRAWLSLRSNLLAVPRWIFGTDVHYFVRLPEQLPAWLFGWRVGRLGEPMPGRTVVHAIQSGVIQRVPPVFRYQNGDVELSNRQHVQPDMIVFATGFSYAFDHLKGLVDLDPDWRPLVKNCESTRTKNLFLLGFRFGRTFASPYLRGISRDAEYIAERIARSKRRK
jgi:putative flavoprotein involved in K+ transport